MTISFSAISLGLAVSALVPTVDAANALAPILLVIGILFGGFYISVKDLPIVANWIPYMSILRWLVIVSIYLSMFVWFTVCVFQLNYLFSYFIEFLKLKIYNKII